MSEMYTASDTVLLLRRSRAPLVVRRFISHYIGATGKCRAPAVAPGQPNSPGCTQSDRVLKRITWQRLPAPGDLLRPFDLAALLPQTMVIDAEEAVTICKRKR